MQILFNLYSIEYTKKTIFNVQNDHCFFCKYSFSWNLMPATRSKKAGTGACLPLCYITFPFNNNPIMTLSCFQLTCSPVECSKQFFESSSTFPVFCCPCPSFFGTRCGHQFKMSKYMQKVCAIASNDVGRECSRTFLRHLTRSPVSRQQTIASSVAIRLNN